MPITPTGFTPRTTAEIVQEITDELRENISPSLDLSDSTVLGGLVQILAPKITELEDLSQEVYSAFDVDNASDDRQVALQLLRGITRRGPTNGLAAATINITGIASIAAGDLVAHVAGEPANRWENRDAETFAFNGNHTVTFISQLTGSDARAPAGTLTVIADPVSGWNSITNAADATEGTDIESISGLRVRGELGVAASASRTRGGIRAALVDLDGVLSAEVFENATGAVDSRGLPPHSIRATVWDGSPAAADDDDIAQAILDTKAEGITSDGSESGTAQDPDVGPVVVSFARAVASDLTVVVTIESETGVSIDDVKAAIIAEMPTRVGEAVKYNRLSGSVFDVLGVDDWSVFTINGGTADLPALISTIYLLDASDITVNGDVS
jgi:uncharacterized phage protein gp47/JayE